MTQGTDPINANSFDPQLHAKGGISSERIAEINNGLTKREYFAAMAMQSVHINSSSTTPIEDVARKSVEFADALINALNEVQ